MGSFGLYGPFALGLLIIVNFFLFSSPLVVVGFHFSLCVCVCVCVCVRACVRECVRVCVRACVRV